MVYVLLIIVIIVFLISFLIFRLAICRNSNKNLIFKNDNNSAHTKGAKIIENDTKWLVDHQRKVHVKSNDGLKLQGYLINNKRNHNYVIVVHGFTSSHIDMINRAQKFNELNNNVLLIDLRGHGDSEGKYITMGIKDSEDIKTWCEYLVKKQGAKKIILYGVSMGAASVMMSLDKNLPKEVKYAIEDCGFTSPYEEYKYQLKNLFHLPAFPILNICSLYAKLIAKFDFKKYSSINSVANTNIPLLMIHGTKDTFVPYYMLEELLKNCNTQKEVFIVKGANHTEAQNLDYDNYWKTIENFIK